MAAGVFNFYIEQGATFGPYVVTHKDADGNPITLVGKTVTGVIRKSLSGPVIVPLNIQILESGSSNVGQYSFGIDANQTAIIPIQPSYGSDGRLSDYLYDIIITASNGVIERNLQGVATVSGGVTR